jgi:TusA-related sulfurtransferase
MSVEGRADGLRRPQLPNLGALRAFEIDAHQAKTDRSALATRDRSGRARSSAMKCLMRINAVSDLSLQNYSLSQTPSMGDTATLARTGEAMGNTIELDVRGLEAPEPLVRVLEALDSLPFADCLLLKIDCRPQPLYRVLERNGYTYEERPGSDALFDISIRKREPA